MILVDTSVWIDHLRQGDLDLEALLNEAQVLTHPFVIGELALGHLRKRDAILSALLSLPAATTAAASEVLSYIDRHKLYGLGIGYIDAHLLAAVRLTPGSALWTRDKTLRAVALRVAVPVR